MKRFNDLIDFLVKKNVFVFLLFINVGVWLVYSLVEMSKSTKSEDSDTNEIHDLADEWKKYISDSSYHQEAERVVFEIDGRKVIEFFRRAGLDTVAMEFDKSLAALQDESDLQYDYDLTASVNPIWTV